MGPPSALSWHFLLQRHIEQHVTKTQANVSNRSWVWKLLLSCQKCDCSEEGQPVWPVLHVIAAAVCSFQSASSKTQRCICLEPFRCQFTLSSQGVGFKPKTETESHKKHDPPPKTTKRPSVMLIIHTSVFLWGVCAAVPTFDQALNNRRHVHTVLDDCDF